jgi:hypothetical protein
MITVCEYHPDLHDEWNGFVQTAKNGHFMFYREYMEYHADRFRDHSLLFYKEGRLAGLLPATIEGDVLCSHAGLTFAGLVADLKMTTSLMFEVVGGLVEHARSSKIACLEYRAQPHIYWDHPSAEDIFVLWKTGAQLYRRDVTTTIDYRHEMYYRSAKRQTIRKARTQGFLITESQEFGAFWTLVSEVLRVRHDSQPVHTMEEISLLHGRFPDNIRLFLCLDRSGELLAGTVLYINRDLVHTQYMAASDAGRACGALDYLLDHLIHHFRAKRYFDFGRSITKDGKVLNEGLVFQKEGFGGRAVTHDFYRLALTP